MLVPYPWLPSLFSHLSCYPRRRFAKVNAPVVCDGRRRGRTGKASHGAGPCLRLTPAGGGRGGQGSGPPAPGQPPGPAAEPPRGPPFESRNERKAGASPRLPLLGTRWGSAAAPSPGPSSNHLGTLPARLGETIRLFHGKASSLEKATSTVRPLHATALERSVPLGLAQTAQVWGTHTLYKGSDPF